MRIVVTSIFVEDQDRALDFYTRVLGFEKRQDVPAGGARWLTLGAPGEDGGVELLLEPAGHPAVAPFMTTAVFSDTVGNLIQIAGSNG
ncbi:VOC family protein [Arthrobacter sp. zg-Y411]|uniref:VOC family protein n=1 Tax=Arthrobacter zhangbolii TaxID=2886936 RepID=UPI001D14CFA3|nr:VOC family protein [Arthrobacter zhangbolii]MCC3293214.1 VOC family protein [Arthrobacter zhangbolii]